MFLRDLLQPMHIIVIVAIYLLFFGTAKLPELGKSLAEGITGFRNAMREGTETAPQPEVKPMVAENPPSKTSVAENITSTPA